MPTALDYIDRLVADGVVPGAVLAVSRGGDITTHVAGTYGDGAVLTPETPHMLLSFTKAVTVTALMRARAFSLDDLVAGHLPEYGCNGKQHTTMRHLLTHSAGIAMQGMGPLDGPRDYGRAVAAISDARAEFEPGTKTAYHPVSGLLVAAHIAQRVTGAMLPELVAEHVTRPLGMGATFDVPDPVVVTHAQGVRGVRWHPAGGMFGTAADVVALLDHHLAQRDDDLHEMHRVQFPSLDPWGVGWMLRGGAPIGATALWFGFTDACSPQAFGHAGGATVIGTADPAAGVSFALMTTAKPAGDDLQTIKVRTDVTNLVLGG